MKYRKKPVVIEAVQWTGDNEEEIKRFAPVAAVFKYIMSNDKSTSLCMEKPQSGYIEATTLEINTLEGVMQASLGDYIIRGVNGEYYPCKPDIFEKTYEKTDSLSAIDFGDAIEVLKRGGAIRRSGWNGKGLFVVKQVPAHIESDIIPKMQSLPQSAKDLILNGKGFVDYTSQCLIYNENTGRADSWVPSVSDMFAEDWEIVLG